MKVQELMTIDVYACNADDALNRAAELMWDHDCGAIPVVDCDRRPIAMITDRDICMASYTQGKALVDMSVSGAMSKGVVVCRSDDSLLAAESMMKEHQLRRLPVVDDDGRLVGILSLNDIAMHAHKKTWSRIVRDELGADAIVSTLSSICSRPASHAAAE